MWWNGRIASWNDARTAAPAVGHAWDSACTESPRAVTPSHDVKVGEKMERVDRLVE